MKAPIAIACFNLMLGSGCAGPSKATTPPEAPEPADETTPAPEQAEAARPEGVIYRDELEAVVSSGPAVLLRNLGPEPVREAGAFSGWRITKVFPEFPGLCEDACDLRPGDIILSVNGDRLETPDAFAAMFERLTKLEQLAIVRIRDGKREDVTYTIVEE